MNTSVTRGLLLCLALAGLGLPVHTVLAEQGHAENTADATSDAHEQEGEHEEEGALKMTAAEREAQGIRTARVAPRALAEAVTAPGEVRMNAYASAQVTPRIGAQVVTRHAHLGETVAKDQPLVTLSSVEMAEAQGALIEADREWGRVRKLGREVVSDQRYVAAQVARQRAYATVRAYGMTDAQVERLLADGDASRATGAFELLSPQAGTVIRDDFVIGEVVEAGRLLFEVSDESILWVEAQLRPEQAGGIAVGTAARVSRDGAHWLDGQVIQLHHRLDEGTRTQGVRIEVANRGDELHPGEYVDVTLQTAAAEARVAVPKDAVLLMQGAPTVFKLEGDELHPQPVETGVTRGGWTEVKAGLADGDEVVIQGAFLLKSLALKSQMGEGHGH
ncbi:MAG: efflux RND transporter periplasmic adaptor subunit [Pseudomonadota bacterium]